MSTQSRSIIRMAALRKKVQRCRTSIYTDVRAGLFPSPIPLGKRSVGWLEHEVDEWIERRAESRRAVKVSDGLMETRK